MYTDDDLNLAVKKQIFTAAAVDEFRQEISLTKNSPSVDEENFRLIGGFNDIFVVIACCLLLFSIHFVLQPFNQAIALFCFVAVAWALAEFFVLKRKMALPAIVLLIAFVGGTYSYFLSFFTATADISSIIPAAAATVAAYCHWLRFKVPITMAAGAAALVALFVAVTLTFFPKADDLVLLLVAIGGIASFFLAMYWDASDLSRTTRNSDIAFWLHLLSAPLIIHPLFSLLGVLEGNQNLTSMAIIIVLYVVLSLISIAIDRRAFMVSSLLYVLYALTTIFKSYGDVQYSIAVASLCMGVLLLLLSAFWHPTRRHVVNWLPARAKQYLPSVVI